MTRAQAITFAGQFEARGYPTRQRFDGSRKYVLLVNTVADRPAAEIATPFEAKRVLANLRDLTKEKAKP